MMDPGCSDLNKKCLPWSWAVEHLVPVGVALFVEV